MKTEFCDRSGKPLYVGDIVQYRLSLNSKHGGPSQLKVVKTKKEIKLVDVRFPELREGLSMGKKYEQYISLVDTSQRES